MPRSSRHKSSSSKRGGSRDYSDSERESSGKDRRVGGKEDAGGGGSRVSKEYGEKRKFVERKEVYGSGNEEYAEEYPLKRARDRVEEGGEDRWNGGGEEQRGDGTRRKEKEKVAELRSKRKDEESEEVVKRGSGRSDGKYRESGGRKDGREGGLGRERGRGRERERDREREKEKEWEREKKGKEGKNDRVVDVEESRSMKQATEKTEWHAKDLLLSAEPENQIDWRARKKKDGSDAEKHPDAVVGINERRIFSRYDAMKDGRSKDEKHKDEYSGEVDRENRHRDDKQRDGHASRDQISNRYDDKHLREEKETAEIRQKKPKPQDGDHDRYSYRNRDHYRDRDYDRKRGHIQGKDGERDYECDRDRHRGRDRDRNHDHDRDWDWDHEQNKNFDRHQDHDLVGNHERDRGRDQNVEKEGAFFVDRSTRLKDGIGKRVSPDDFYEFADSKSGVTQSYLDTEKRSAGASRSEFDPDRGRSQSILAPMEKNTNSSRQRFSPNTCSHEAQDEHRDAVTESRNKANSSREMTGFVGSSERASKYRSAEKPVKMDDGHVRELSQERSSNSKASPVGLVDRSPSSQSLEQRVSSRSVGRRSIDIEESGKRDTSSASARDFPFDEDREEHLFNDLTLVDSPFRRKGNQNHSGLIPSSFRGGIGSPALMNSMEDDIRVNAGPRHRRSGDHPRGQGTAWRGPPNWPSPLSNGFVPFPHGPPHGGFQAMMPQFPSPFGVRPPIEMNHSGIPYIPDSDRFSGNFRPLAWQTMMDGTGPPHLHGWDGKNGLFRDEMHLFGGPEWDQKRHMNSRGWESSADAWKMQNGDTSMELPPASMKDVLVLPLIDDVKSVPPSRSLQSETKENIHLVDEAREKKKKPAITDVEESCTPPSLAANEKTSDVNFYFRAYLSKLDISDELAPPELYSQCMSSPTVKISPTVHEDGLYLVNLKDGAKAEAKGSLASLSSSLFPTISNSVFQRAMDIYNKQRVGLNGFPIANGVMAEVDSALEVEEQNDMGGTDTSVHNDAEMAEVPILHQKKAVLSTTTLENPEQMVSAPIKEGDGGHAHSPCLKPEVLVNRSSSDDVTDKPVELASGSSVEEIQSDGVNTEDANVNVILNPSNLPQSAIITDAANRLDGDVEIGTNVSGCADGRHEAFVLTDGSTKVSDDFMPGLNESESVILSRIHHSPKSTH